MPGDFDSQLQNPAKPVLKNVLTYDDVHQGIELLLAQARVFNPDYIYAINRGGAIVGGMLAKRLDMPLVYILEVRKDAKPQVVDHGKPAQGLKDRRILLVDDSVRTGTRMELASRYILKHIEKKNLMKMALLNVSIEHPGRLTAEYQPVVDKYAYFTHSGKVFLPWDSEGEKELPSAQDKLLQTIERLSSIGVFAQTNLEPEVSPRTVVACFSDVRGFTRYCDALQARQQSSIVESFVADFFPILYHSLALRYVGVGGRVFDAEEENLTTVEMAQDLLRPSGWKTLGDGMMVVWELRPDKKETWPVAARTIFEAMISARSLFDSRLAANKDKYGPEVAALHLGFGLSKGEVLRLDFPGLSVPDYLGTVINIASRLVGEARPEGIIADVEVSRQFFRHLAEKGVGKLRNISLKGIEGKKQVWCSDEVVIEEISRKKPPRSPR